MNRLGQALGVADLNQCTVGEKGIVKCDKRIVIATGKPSKFALQAGQAAGQVGHRHAAWLVVDLRQCSVEMAIDKDQSIGTQLAEYKIAKLLLAKLSVKRINSWTKRQFGYRFDIGEAPILVSQSWVIRLGEPGQAGLA